VAFPRAIVAPNHEDFFSGLDETDDFLDWFLNSGVHDSSPLV
jgi:hypothetical protein